MEAQRLPYTTEFKTRTFIVRETEGFSAGQKLGSSDDLFRWAELTYRSDGLDADKEHFVVVCCNNKNQYEGHKVISTGSLTASLVHPREVFKAALAFSAAAILLLHNHPSGDPAPSQEDIEITRRLKQVAEIFGIRLLDHVVMGTQGRFFSFSDKGLL